LPKVSTFHNPLATASINASERATNAEPTQRQFTRRQAKLPIRRRRKQRRERRRRDRCSLSIHLTHRRPHRARRR
jgi:hypothetical protein